MLPLITFTSPIAQALVSSAVIVSKSMATKFKFLIKTKTVHTSGGHSLGANLKNSCYALLLRSLNALNGRYQSFHAAKIQNRYVKFWNGQKKSANFCGLGGRRGGGYAGLLIWS